MDTNDSAVGSAATAEALLVAGRHDEALVLLSIAQRAYPTDIPILKLISRAFIANGRTDLAIGALLAAVEMGSSDANVHQALSILLFRAGRVHEAMAHGIQSFEQAPTAEHATSLGTVLMDLGLYREALGLFDHALELEPAHWEPLNNRSLSLQGLERFDEVIAAGLKAIEAAPNNAKVRFNHACALLGMAQMTSQAWALFESRLDLESNLPWVQDWAALRWHGEDIAGLTILVHAEQGFGDTIQFLRYLPLVARRARHVVVAVQPALLKLVRNGMGVDAVAIGAPLPPFDVMTPLLSLPGLFGTTLDTIPAVLPWLGRKFPPRSQGLQKVGLAWRGSKTFADDRRRSLAAEHLTCLASVRGVTFISLQKHEYNGDEWPSDLELIDAMTGICGFDETSAIIAGLDLVITVDTAVGHLAATMGKPVWLLTRWRGCWRWLHRRTDSPWYPTMRLFRQSEPNNWSDTMDQVRRQLEDWSNTRPADETDCNAILS